MDIPAEYRQFQSLIGLILTERIVVKNDYKPHFNPL